MNQRSAKHRVCAYAATVLVDEIQHGNLDDHFDGASPDDAQRLRSAAEELVDELVRRAGLPPRGAAPVQLEGQLNLLDA